MHLETQNPTVADEIVDVADALFERYGYQKTTVDEIAREAGIGKGTVYLHFASKEEIGIAWVDRLHQTLIERLRAISAANGSPIDRLKMLLVARVLFRQETFLRHQRSMDESFEKLKKQLTSKREACHAREAAVIVELINEAERSGLCRPIDASKAAESMVLATNGLMPYSMRPEAIGSLQDVERKAKDLAELLVAGIEVHKGGVS
ncbi:MAG: TetR/AcrR family transcriptional regulator [Armatimonadetes bacterium]|nr:TetR/AcrR family transcriptional regulator [Armatimonadota bacterium]